ncbi:hypothetical protein GmHk_05G012275 [Glycine max]|uniref:Uncharacterized protein n=1 Tax=Glycine soja TaxID=3848 RepID=A0A445KIR3_GLYSO|nr:hypothetical protein GmHk_05G012275 [Glycine max]RZC10792.1 hypothetical protein D0Y65_011169 [Glycine soja]
MALRELIVMGLLLLVCLAKVSSDVNIEKEQDEEFRFPVDHASYRERREQKANAGHRLWRIVQDKVQCPFKAKCVQQGLWHMLCEVQVCSTWNFRQQGALWDLLY